MRTLRGRHGELAGAATERAALALTFDDGPSLSTPAILDALAAVGARATFFLVGERIAGREPLVGRIAAEGHELGNHSWSHPWLTDLPAAEIESELVRTSAAIAAVAGRPPSTWRPPFGAIDSRVAAIARATGMTTVTWSVDPKDWRAGRDPDAIAAGVLDGADPGAIVLLHDVDEGAATLAALGEILAVLAGEGTELIPARELLELPLAPLTGPR